MEGLEVAIIPLLQLERTKRVDAEFFKKRHLELGHSLQKCKTQPIDCLTSVSDGNHFEISGQFSEAGIPYYRGQDVVGHFFIEQASPVFIPHKAYSQPHMVRSHLQKGDVLLSIVGTIGELSLVSSASQATCSCKLAILRPKTISPEYLSVFLRSEAGRAQIERFTRGAVQRGLLLEDMDQISVVRLGDKLEGIIAREVTKAQSKLGNAEKAMQETEQFLLSALGLENWHPPDPLTYTRRASEVFAARRVDSPYFSPRVSELLQLLARDNARIGDVAPTRHEEFVAGSSGEFDYIEIGDIQTDGATSSNRLPQSEAPSRATWYVRSGDVLASTVRPIRRLSAIVAPEQDSFVCSSGFVVLAPQTISSELLLTYLRLPQVCELMDLHTSASMYPAISEGDLLNLPFRRVSSDVERKIATAVKKSHSARREAYIRLDRAKRAVEIAIEQSEAEALRYLSESSV